MAHGGKRSGAGRLTGSQNKNTAELRLDLVRALLEGGFNPASRLIEVHNEAMRMFRLKTDNSATGFGAVGYLQIARESASDLMAFAYPKKKSVELTDPNGESPIHSLTELFKRIADKGV